MATLKNKKAKEFMLADVKTYKARVIKTKQFLQKGSGTDELKGPERHTHRCLQKVTLLHSKEKLYFQQMVESIGYPQ